MDTTAPFELVRSWPVEDQLEFVFKLWDHILDSDPQVQPKMSPELREELQLRIAAYEANPAKTYSWDEVAENARKQL